MMLDWPRLLEVGGAIIGTGGLSAFFARRKTRAETHSIEAAAYKTETDARHVHWEEMESFIKTLREEIGLLRERVTAAEGNASAAKTLAAEAVAGQHACEERELGLIARIASLEASRNEGTGS